jgi:protoporphyrinogen oxidase
MIRNKKVVILGGGLSGLSAAWHLQKKGIACSLFEKENSTGGLCRSKQSNGFTFDSCGHLLHFKHRYAFGLVKRLLSGNLVEHKKSAWIFSHKTFTRYPFQVNLYGLPQPVVKECLLEFIKARFNGKNSFRNDPSFLDWINQTLGKGIARHFMVPYNSKFWTIPPSKITCEWFDGFIPVPSLKEVIEGTIGTTNRIFGYNARFWYPAKGGIGELTRAFSSGIKNISLGEEAQSIDLAGKTVHFSGGNSVKFDFLISTIPLPEFLRLAGRLPKKIASSLKQLKHNSIFNLNLGIDRQGLSGKHWVYFPEKKYPFFRAGFFSSFSRGLCPPGTSSLYIEASYSEDKPIDKDDIEQRLINGMFECGILRPSDRILAREVNDIKYGYIIYDRNRCSALKQIKGFLKEKGVFCLGRYGGWEYFSMEDAILEGRKICEVFI